MDANQTAEQNIRLFIGAVQNKELRAFLDSNINPILALSGLEGDARKELRQQLLGDAVKPLEANYREEY